jgi:RNA polymerase sigma-70 factor (ECF subfamily)
MEAARAAPGGRRKNLSLKLAPRARRQKETFDAAFEGFYREHVAEVYQYALAVLGNSADAEDVTQQTFLNAYRAFQRGERPEKAHNWLIKIAHNVCRMRWRQSGRRPQEVPLERAGEPAAPDDERPSLDVLLSALAKLPFNQRAAIVMREVEDRSYAEIAEVLGVSVPAVEALLFRARGNLRERRKALAGALSSCSKPLRLSQRASSLGAWVSRRSALSLRPTRRRLASSSSKVRHGSLPQTSCGGRILAIRSVPSTSRHSGTRCGPSRETARSAARPPTAPPPRSAAAPRSPNR